MYMKEYWKRFNYPKVSVVDKQTPTDTYHMFMLKILISDLHGNLWPKYKIKSDRYLIVNKN